MINEWPGIGIQGFFLGELILHDHVIDLTVAGEKKLGSVCRADKYFSATNQAIFYKAEIMVLHKLALLNS